jgi:hypothetical protein
MDNGRGATEDGDRMSTITWYFDLWCVLLCIDMDGGYPENFREAHFRKKERLRDPHHLREVGSRSWRSGRWLANLRLWRGLFEPGYTAYDGVLLG